MSKTNHPFSIAAQMSSSPKLAVRACGYALTKNQIRAISELQAARQTAKRRQDPLLLARASRLNRRPSVVAQRRAEHDQWIAAQAADYAFEQARAKRAEERHALRAAARKSLYAAARAARKMGLFVDHSQDRSGNISSYYCQNLARNEKIRISDHLIPDTEYRQLKTDGLWDGYRGPEIIIDRPRSALWIKRALILATHGRSVYERS